MHVFLPNHWVFNLSTFCPLFCVVLRQRLPALQGRDPGSVPRHFMWVLWTVTNWDSFSAKHFRTSGAFYHLTIFFILPFIIWPHSSFCLLSFDRIFHSPFYRLTTFFIVPFIIWPHSSLCLLSFDHILHSPFYHLTTFFILPFIVWPHSSFCLLSFDHIFHSPFYHLTTFFIVPFIV